MPQCWLRISFTHSAPETDAVSRRRRHLAENEDFMFLQKPFDLKELAAAVKTALQG